MAGQTEISDEIVNAATTLMSARDINSVAAIEAATTLWDESLKRAPSLASIIYAAGRSIDSRSNAELALTLNRVAVSLMASRAFSMATALGAAEKIIKAAVEAAAGAGVEAVR